MNEITEKEIDKISREIDQSGLTYMELKNELLDHICCQVEQDMEQGMLFNEAYRKVKLEMGRKRIRQIQHETLSLISKKYRRMKRTMYVMGVIAPALVIAASLFKLMHWPGGSVLITLGLVMVGLIFLPLYVMTRIRDTRKLGEPLPESLYITGMASGMVSILGALFKIMHWPGASVLLTVGLVSFAFIFLPMFAITKLREAKTNNLDVNRGVIIGGVMAGILFIVGALFKIMHWPGAGYVIVANWTVVGLVFFPLLVLNQLKKSKNQMNTFLSILVVATGVSIFIMALIRADYRQDTSGYLNLMNTNAVSADFHQLQSQSLLNEAELNSETLPVHIAELVAQADRIDQYIERLEMEMVKEIVPDDAAIFDENREPDYSLIDVNGQRNFAYFFLTEMENFNLYEMLRTFSATAMRCTNNPELKTFIEKEYYFELEHENPEEAWARKYFLGPYIRSASMLGMFQSTVRMTEYEILREYAAQPEGIAEAHH